MPGCVERNLNRQNALVYLKLTAEFSCPRKSDASLCTVVILGSQQNKLLQMPLNRRPENADGFKLCPELSRRRKREGALCTVTFWCFPRNKHVSSHYPDDRKLPVALNSALHFELRKGSGARSICGGGSLNRQNGFVCVKLTAELSRHRKREGALCTVTFWCFLLNKHVSGHCPDDRKLLVALNSALHFGLENAQGRDLSALGKSEQAEWFCLRQAHCRIKPPSKRQGVLRGTEKPEITSSFISGIGIGHIHPYRARSRRRVPKFQNGGQRHQA
ncbi:hypothetical protein B0H13DRAFT_1850414 [Mycena leptocephala]|nr:hypothetical protein B0H13DRAFT_1850414 [Mycena leptocephala]